MRHGSSSQAGHVVNDDTSGHDPVQDRTPNVAGCWRTGLTQITFRFQLMDMSCFELLQIYCCSVPWIASLFRYSLASSVLEWGQPHRAVKSQVCTCACSHIVHFVEYMYNHTLGFDNSFDMLSIGTTDQLAAEDCNIVISSSVGYNKFRVHLAVVIEWELNAFWHISRRRDDRF